MKAPLPYKHLTLFSIIDEIDFPILSHYKDEKNNDILEYYLGYSDNVALSLFWKTQEIDLFNYLNNKITLRELITEASKEFLYLFEGDSDNYEYIIPSNINTDYLPDGKSYFGFGIPEKYEYLIEKYVGDFYIASLNERGIVLNITPKERRYQTTVSMDDVAVMTSQISSSIKSFVSQKFYKEFTQVIADIKTFELTKKKIIKRTIPRVCDTRFGSFEITISNDRITNDGLDPLFNDWSNSILNIYENEVLYRDYSNSEVVKEILENSSVLEIKSIYEPIINIIASKDFILSARTVGTDKSIKFDKNYRNTKKAIRKKLSTTENEDTHVTKKKLVHVVLEIEANQEIQMLKKSQINRDIVISYETDNFTLQIDQITTPFGQYSLVNPLEFDVKIDENNNYWVEDNLLIEPIFIVDKNLLKEEIMRAINNIVTSKYNSDIKDFFSKNDISFK